MKLKIITLDLLIADIIFDDKAAFEKILRENNFPDLQSTEKFSTAEKRINNLFYKKLPLKPEVTAGGTGANTLWTMNSLLGKKNVEATYIGVLGEEDNDYHSILKTSLSKANIHLSLIKKENIKSETAKSYVCNYDDRKAIMTYQGNAHKIITPDDIDINIVAENDVVFLLGSTWRKFDNNVPDKLLEYRWKKKKRLWLSMPTSAEFVNKTPGIRRKFSEMAFSAEKILSNDDELKRIFKTDDTETALEIIHEYFNITKNSTIMHDAKNILGDHQQVAFITMGKKGAAIVDSENIDFVPSQHNHNEREKIYPTGAGDCATGAFLAAMESGINPKQSAEFAMLVAKEKLKTPGSRLQNPEKTLKKIAQSNPKIVSAILKKRKS